jgi:peptidoglycan/LPS O-acetylase OafA/YrhL
MPGLDGLRGILLLGIMAYHLGYAEHMFVTVDSFFVLSGFLITGLLLDHTPTNGRELGAWWGRRARRLVPAAAVTAALVVVIFASTEGIARDAFASLTWWANWEQVFSEHGYWSAGPAPLRHTWSLSIEEQFYLVWPAVMVLLIAAARKLRAKPHLVVGGFAAALAVVSFAWSAWLASSGTDLNRIYLGTDTRASALLLGCAIATIPHVRRGRATEQAGRWLTAMGIAGGLLVLGLGLTLHIDDVNTYRGGLALGVLGSVAIVMAASRPGRVASALSLRPFQWLGVRSYGIYLLSWPAQLLIEDHWPNLGRPTVAILTFAVALALGAASLRVVEAPLRHGHGWARRPEFRRAAWSIGGTTAVIAVVAVGLTAPPPPEQQAISTAESARIALEDARNSLRSTTTEAPPGTVSTTTVPTTATHPTAPSSTVETPAPAATNPPTSSTPPAAPPPPPPMRIMTAGDSQAFMAAAPKIPRDKLPPYIESVTTAGVLGCGILVRAPEWTMFDPDRGGDVPGAYCLDSAEVAEVEALKARPDWMVVFSGGFERPFGYKDRTGRLVPARDPELRASIVKHLSSRVERARAHGVRTALVEWACMGEEAGNTEKAGWTRWHNKILSEVAASIPGTAIIEPNDKVCVNSDPTGSPTPDKERAWGHEVHPKDLEWLWNVQLGPELLAASFTT